MYLFTKSILWSLCVAEVGYVWDCILRVTASVSWCVCYMWHQCSCMLNTNFSENRQQKISWVQFTISYKFSLLLDYIQTHFQKLYLCHLISIVRKKKHLSIAIQDFRTGKRSIRLTRLLKASAKGFRPPGEWKKGIFHTILWLPKMVHDTKGKEKEQHILLTDFLGIFI